MTERSPAFRKLPRLHLGARNTWLVGDVQGCKRTLDALLERVAFSPEVDRIWFAGDLVNRGADSLEVLRWMFRHRDAVDSVLGNHDLHLLALAAGVERKVGTLGPVLVAPDGDELIGWLRRRPLLAGDEERLLVHAGVPPHWSLSEALRWGSRVEERLRGAGWKDWLRALYDPEQDDDEVVAEREAVAHLTRIRACTEAGEQADFSGPPEDCPSGTRPWYAWRKRPLRLYFGHWAAHGACVNSNWVSLDSGAVWGGALTAVNLVDDAAVQVASQESGAGDI